jgi:hypothetical protein
MKPITFMLGYEIDQDLITTLSIYLIVHGTDLSIVELQY